VAEASSRTGILNFFFKKDRKMEPAEREGVVRVLGCFDSFKDSLEADLVADAVLHAIAHLYPGSILLFFHSMKLNLFLSSSI
jgi:hypothetical protein